MTLEEFRLRKTNVLGVAHRYGADNVRVFGSVARGDAGRKSDVDLLVRFNQDASLLDLVGMTNDLADLLGTKVDVATEQSLHWYVRDRVLAEAVSL